jgi:hypothetical protein
MPPTTCPKCHSTDLLPPLPVYGQQSTVEPPLFVVLREPEPANRPFVWKPGAQRAYFHATICGQCGYSELYASEPQKLLDAYRQGYR